MAQFGVPSELAILHNFACLHISDGAGQGANEHGRVFVLGCTGRYNRLVPRKRNGDYGSWFWRRWCSPLRRSGLGRAGCGEEGHGRKHVGHGSLDAGSLGL